jgi:photosystem II stability/assembly factor-like uncharacterized protein
MRVVTTTAVVVAAIVLVAVFFAREETSPPAGTISSGGNTLLVHRVDAERLLVGTGDGVEWIELRPRSVRALAPNYADQRDGLLLAGSEEGVLRTTDKGQSWDSVLSLEGGATAVAFSQSTVGIAYALDRGGAIYRSADFGATWMATR